jgi:hypothetical protein
MINISEVKVGRRYGDWFVRNTQKVFSLGDLTLVPLVARVSFKIVYTRSNPSEQCCELERRSTTYGDSEGC